MLGKLIKHEWKETYKAGCLMLGVVALITFMGWLAFRSPMWNGMENTYYYGRFGWLDVLSIFTLIMYVIMLIVVNYGILIFLGIHFYRTMYTDQGYLTHTLPVTKGQILGSKVLVSGLWMIIILLSVYLSVILLGMFLVSAFMPEGYSLSDLWREIAPEMSQVLYYLKEDLDLDLIRWLVNFIIVSFLSPFVTITTLFGAISIGQLFSKYRVLMAIVSYIGITVVVNLVNSLIRNVATMFLYGSLGSYVNTSMDTSFIVKLTAAVILYCVSWYITSKKLNMA